MVCKQRTAVCAHIKTIVVWLSGRLRLQAQWPDELNDTPFSIDQPGRVFGLERFRLSRLQTGHDFPLQRAQDGKWGREIPTNIFHPGGRRPVAVIQ